MTLSAWQAVKTRKRTSMYDYGRFGKMIISGIKEIAAASSENVTADKCNSFFKTRISRIAGLYNIV